MLKICSKYAKYAHLIDITTKSNRKRHRTRGRPVPSVRRVATHLAGHGRTAPPRGALGMPRCAERCHAMPRDAERAQGALSPRCQRTPKASMTFDELLNFLIYTRTREMSRKLRYSSGSSSGREGSVDRNFYEKVTRNSSWLTIEGKYARARRSQPRRRSECTNRTSSVAIRPVGLRLQRALVGRRGGRVWAPLDGAHEAHLPTRRVTPPTPR